MSDGAIEVTMWGGRFGLDPDESLWSFTVDHSDRRLLVDDITGSIAHVNMLERVGLVTTEDATTLTGGLETVLDEAQAGSFGFESSDEDVHSAVERRLGELIGEVAGRLHTGRSRNDQVCLDLRMYLRRSAKDRREQLGRFAALLVDVADRADGVIVPSYTHLQQAQAIPFGHHLLAYAWMVLRDRDRFGEVIPRLDVSPLGAGAAGGSSLPLDPKSVASELGFTSTFSNSLDAVASRDFVAEYAFCCAQAMAHLSRLSEDLILWSSYEFSWVTLDDRFSTGSSALPHKKNPDVAELARGKAATVNGDVVALLSLQKGLPLSYNRDLQEDKRAVFHADDTLNLALTALAGLLDTMSLHPPSPSPWVAALDLAEALTLRGVPFRSAHTAVGSLVARLVADGRSLAEATAEDLTAADPRFDTADISLIEPQRSVESRVTPGGGSVDAVQAQISAIREMLS